MDILSAFINAIMSSAKASEEKVVTPLSELCQLCHVRIISAFDSNGNRTGIQHKNKPQVITISALLI